MTTRRALHYVFKIGARAKTFKFYKEILGMKVLRHEEFHEGCEAYCNGPYDGKWSKTMMGYGPEDDHFVVELTYNYGISSYKQGNSFCGITIQSSEAVSRARQEGWPSTNKNGLYELHAPGGYVYFLVDKPQPKDRDPVMKVSLASSNLGVSCSYWNELLGMEVVEKSHEHLRLQYSSTQAGLEFKLISDKVDHAKAGGRIAFSCPVVEQEAIQESIKNKGHSILVPLLSLDTPGKATVRVVILADPDQHEICFVGDEAFRQLSQVDPEGDRLLTEAIEKDKSDEWFAKKGLTKSEG